MTMESKVDAVSTQYLVHAASGGACFFADADYQHYLELLRESSALRSVAVHAYVLTGGVVHLLVSVQSDDEAGAVLREASERYAGYVARTYHRAGRVMGELYTAAHIEADETVLDVYRHVERVPARTGLVAHACRHRWSSFPRNAMGCADPVITPHPVYLALGRSGSVRQQAYRDRFRRQPDFEHLRDLGVASNERRLPGYVRSEPPRPVLVWG